MHILALETSSLHGSVAAAIDSQLLISRPLPRDCRTAQSLAPIMRDVLNELDWQVSQLDLIAITAGPGSFTGLRIGITTAKTLAYAAGAKVVGVNTLEALAVAAAGSLSEGDAIYPLINAHRNEFFAATYQKADDGRVVTKSEVEIVDIDSWLAADAPDAWLTGPMLPKLAAEIGDRWPNAKLCDETLWTPDATAVASIGYRLAEEGQCDDVFALVPNYYRPSYAEEKRKQ